MWKKYHCISVLRQNCLNGFLIFETKYTHYRFHRRYDQGIQLTQLISIYIKLHYDTRFAKKIYWRYACVILPTILRQKNQKKILPFESSAYYLRILKKRSAFFAPRLLSNVLQNLKVFYLSTKILRKAKWEVQCWNLYPTLKSNKKAYRNFQIARFLWATLYIF